MNASEVSIGLAHEIVIRLVKVGAEVSDLVILSKDEDIGRKVISLIRETMETVSKKFLVLVNSNVVINRLKKVFVVADHFKVDISDQAKVKISYLGDNFQAWCLKATVKPRAGYQASSRQLTKGGMNDEQIRAKINVSHETDLPTVFSLMKKQGQGQSGVLLVNGYANIFYVRDSAGELRAVSVYWSGDGWHVHADSVKRPDEWDGGDQVFSRNSVA